MSGIVYKASFKKLIVTVAIIASIVLILSGVYLFFAHFHTPENIIREALKENALTERRYILCQLHRVTGFDWVLVQDENGEEVYDFIYITGANPIAEHKLSYEFEMGRNTYIFYVEEKNEGHLDYLGLETTEYIVSGWDILYPVRRVTFISPRRYITLADIRRLND